MSDARAILEQGLAPTCVVLQGERRARHGRSVLARAVRRLPSIAAIGVAVLAVAWLLRLAPADTITWATLLWMIVVAALPLLAMAIALTRAPHVGTYDAALAHDRQHHAHDRLSAALELSSAAALRAEPTRTTHMAEAAVEDGLVHLRAVDAADVREASVAARPSPRLWLLGVAVAALGLVLPRPLDGSAVDDATTPRVAKGPEASAAAARSDDRPRDARDEKRPESAAQSRAERREAAPPERNPSVPALEAAAATAAAAGASGSTAGAQPTQAAAGKPKPAQAGAASSGNEGSGGQGQASDSAAEAQPEKEAAAKARKPKPKRPAKEEPPQPATPSESAATPSGPSRGGGKMAPVGNTRKGIDRGVERDDDLDTDDEDIEDQKEESEQRGGVMPLSRDRNTPAGRELSISADGPPNDGRGGPTPPKKSRGTASLVLGINLPDQVRGQPNPGTAKTSIEQTPPHPEPAHRSADQPAAPSGPGHSQHRALASTIESIVLRYHELMKQTR